MKIRPHTPGEHVVEGKYLQIDDEPFFRIHNYDRMEPFLISVVSDSDHWMYISSTGGLTAGRRDPDHALFPYYTDDKLHDAYPTTGSFTRIRVGMDNDVSLWAPFSPEYDFQTRVERNLYKNKIGNKLVFEEINHDLGLTYRYGWYISDRFGFVRKSKLINHSGQDVEVQILDGIRNILPTGIQRLQQMTLSTLMNAYKKNELLEPGKIGLFMLSSIPVDRAEPSESLRATSVWSQGMEAQAILLSDLQIGKFIQGKEISTEWDIRARRGAYLLYTEEKLKSGDERQWLITADVAQDAADVARLAEELQSDNNIVRQVNEDIAACSENLDRLIASADGVQLTADRASVNRHYSNTLFNIMRGGVFFDNYKILRGDYVRHVRAFNTHVFNRYEKELAKLPDSFDLHVLEDWAGKTTDSDLIRITREYLPLIFGRRHGDPSRPWNLFSIDLKDSEGNRVFSYQGNWRDIFQNWEALSLSFPDFVENMIAKFVNASTPDGYNPYRISRDGIDWEVLEPDDPWSYVGYWGDHQIIYLLRLLQLSDQVHPGLLNGWLTERQFTFGNVPYRIKPYDELVKDPSDTILFDQDQHEKCMQRYHQLGADGKLLMSEKEEVIYATFFEKLLIQLLTKLYNFVPDAGIWLNTQRPEWNDANNALVGNGCSMVTVYYLRSHILFLQKFLEQDSQSSYEVYEGIGTLYQSIGKICQEYLAGLSEGLDDRQRKKMTDRLGEAGSIYREQIYERGFGKKNSRIEKKGFLSFLSTALRFIDKSIENNVREDGLFHAYNLIEFRDDQLEVTHLYEMLEGQVAALSSGYLSPAKAVSLLDKLRESKMYRPDQDSYMLYPDRQLARFMEKNVIPAEAVRGSSLLKELADAHNQDVIRRDVDGNYHFNAQFRNKNILRDKLREYSDDGKEIMQVLDVYESIFHHKAFTGRSGTFYGYEGLGSIYWHMVSKLLLAVQEYFWHAVRNEEDEAVIYSLKEHYYEIRKGIGYEKNPADYGAFPTDAYSHTPGGSGVKQPGLTGQVKEDVISRFAELGVHVKQGRIGFDRSLLREEEFMRAPSEFMYYTVAGKFSKIPLNTNELAFTCCQVPVTYKLSDREEIRVTIKGQPQVIDGLQLDEETSRKVFGRTGEVEKIEVSFS